MKRPAFSKRKGAPSPGGILRKKNNLAYFAGLLVLILTVLAGSLTAWAQPDYAPAHWTPPACTKSYSSGNGHHFCVIHDMEGYYESSISFLNRCDTDASGNFNVDTSVYYLVNGLKNGSDEDGHSENNSGDVAPGDITQSVRESRYAWHARCWNTWMFGTEHEGFVSSPAWYSEAMYQASAGLQRHLCDTYGIPRDRNHIIGHDEKKTTAWRVWMTNNYPAIDPTCNSHTDPGIYWNWSHFMDLINGRPGINTQPWSRAVDQGSNVTFSVSASGSAPLSYQWRKSGVNLAGATASSYSLLNLQSSNAGNYTVVITNGFGAVTSRVAKLSVNPLWVTAFSDNLDVNSAGNWKLYWGAGDGVSDFTTNWAFNYSNATYLANGVTTPIPSAPNSGGTKLGLKITVNKNDGNAAISGVSLYPKNVTFSNSYTLRFDAWINYNGGAGGGSGSTEYLSAGLNQAGTRVNWVTNNATASDGLWFAVDGEGGSGGSDYRVYQGTGVAPTAMTFGTGGLAASGAASDNVADEFYQSLFLSPPYESAGAPGKHWVQVEVSQVGNVITWQLNGVVVAQRNNTGTFTNGNVMVGYFDPYISIASPLADNFLILDNIRVLIAAIAPTILTPPQSVTNNQGANAIFAVTATGLPAPAYQWRFSGTNIPGATGSSYTRANIQPADSGSYSVVVTNVAGVLTSTVAMLTVNIPPSITTQPQDQSVKAGTNVAFTIASSGTAPLVYQWRFNEINITGATNSSYTRSEVTTNDAGNYSVIVTNVAGNVISSNAVLAVTPSLPLEFGGIELAGDQLKLVLTGEPGMSITIWRSDDLTNWISLTNLSNPMGTIEFTDSVDFLLPQRFYRAQLFP